jgi:preprotein translocase subunit SecG
LLVVVVVVVVVVWLLVYLQRGKNFAAPKMLQGHRWWWQ